MKGITLLILCVILFGLFALALRVPFAIAATGWSQTYGGTEDEIAWSVIQTNDGGYAVTGFTNSSGAGGRDFWLVKVDSSGNKQWSQTYGGTKYEGAWSLVETSDGGYALAGYTESYGAGSWDFWLVKTDSSGNKQWSQTYGGTGLDMAWSVVQTSDGGYALAGYTGSYGAGGQDFWLVKTDSSGNKQWSQTYGGTKDEVANSVVRTSDGGYAVAGYTESYGAGSWDFWLVKTDGSGNMQWNKTYGEADAELANSMVRTSDGGYALAGWTESYGAGSWDFWLVKTDSSGNKQWSQTYGGTERDYANCVVQTSDGGYALAGDTNSSGAGGEDFWLVKVDSSGNKQWSQTYGGTGLDLADSVVQTSDGGYVLSGITFSYGAGGEEAWLIKTDESGVVPEFPSFLVISLFMITTLLAVIIHRRRHLVT